MAEDAMRKSQCVSSTRDALIIESVGGIGGDSDLIKWIGYQPDIIISTAFFHQCHLKFIASATTYIHFITLKQQ